MGSSTLIQLAPYLLLEYIYGDASTTYLATQVKPARLTNDYLKGQELFLNTNPARNLTGNVLDYTAANLGGVDWVILDKDVPVPYISQDSNLQYVDLSSTLSSLNIKYDKIRFHIQSGYNFEEIEGLVLQAYVREAMTDITSLLTSSVVLKGSDRFTFNPSPIFITDKLYDRYIEVLVPSVKAANQDYYANPANKNSIGGQYTTDQRGFLLTTQIYIKAYEVDTVSKKNGITFFKTNRTYEIPVRQDDIYGSVAAVVREATDGDYFEYFPTNNGNFIEELIQDLNSQGGNYVVVNQIDVIEQVGLRFITTFSFTYIQNTGFDGPSTFRPILKYADIAPSFSIEYTARIYNTENAFQIIKKASTTSYNPRKYGKNTEKIALSNVTSPLKVFNKVFNGQQLNYGASAEVSPFNTVYVPVFYESRNLFIGAKTVIAEGANPLSPNFTSDDIYFGQGTARIYLGEFEQYVKFSLRQYVALTNSLNLVDLSKLTMYIGFTDSTDKIFTIPALPSSVENSLADGEVVFKIPGNVKQRMGLNDASVTKTFYILSENQGTGQVKIYNGTVQSDENMSSEPTRITALGSQAITVKDLLAGIGATGSTAGNAISPNLGVKASSQSLVSQLNNMNITSVLQEEQQQILSPVIPGFTVDSNAESINAIAPVSLASTASNIGVTSTVNSTNTQ
jgi:hypothetical protein